LYHSDTDGDGFGAAPTLLLCEPLAGYVLDNTDCDDTDNTVYPGAPGTASDIDNDCNGTIDPDEANPCPGDFNTDGFINVSDLLILLGDYGCQSNCIADLSGDGVVNASDMLLFLGVFATVCD
jgi:hypothetical protein